jgi:hypothetical protein
VLFRRVYCSGQLSGRAYLRAVSAVISTIDDHIRTGGEAETIRSSEPPRLPSQAHDQGKCLMPTSGSARIADKAVSALDKRGVQVVVSEIELQGQKASPYLRSRTWLYTEG